MPQINCHNFFPFHFGNAIATNQLPQFFFFFLNFSPRFRQLGCHNSFFFFFPPIFGNLVATIHIFSLLPSLQFRLPQLVSLWAPHLALVLQALHTPLGSSFGASRISVISLSKFNFFSLLHHFTYLPSLSYFFLQFQRRCC